ncbi:hypothetical protein [uncultured Winogradskyella sp.]|uniref:hypothetical protein n=1 Tax=uncultured Winogradskyella sp. TaxID=395353 RepID=UPI0025FFE605|nr:hypothetical protein [uncultured Winogradskyella sp.]
MKKSLFLVFIFSCIIGYAQNIVFPYSTTVRDTNGLLSIVVGEGNATSGNICVAYPANSSSSVTIQPS